MNKIIFHIDINSAFLSWEATYRLKILGEKIDYREVPSIVGGSEKTRHGIVLAKSIPAKKYGIQTGEPVRDAINKCPGLYVLPPRYDLYEQSSRAFMQILREYAPNIEQYSIDEAYCDMTGTQYLYGSPVTAAHLIKDHIYRELGFSANVGVSSNKLLAKMASDFKKPNMVHTLFPEEIESKLWGLPVSDLFYVGKATTRKLAKLGIYTIGELANTDVRILRNHLHKHGEMIHNFANGRDVSIVDTELHINKGYGNSTTIPYDVNNARTAKLVLLSLCETVCARLRADEMKASVVAVTICDYEFNYLSHQSNLFTATNITNEIYKACCRLFDEVWDGTPIRKLGVLTSKVKKDDDTHQLDLFTMNDYERYSKLDKAVDAIRNRYGDTAIMRASYVGGGVKHGQIEHMSGGISKSKKNPVGGRILL